jgi:NTE family protein
VRGFAHFGVLRELERAGIRPDCLAGTSVGSAAAALYALGLGPDEAANAFLRCGPALFRPTISTRGFLSSRGVRNFIRGFGHGTLIEELPLPFAAVGADIAAQREVVFRRGLLWQAVVASISIPGIYPANRIGDYTVVDGGVVNPVPCSVAADLGADVVIGVKLGGPLLPPHSDVEAVEARGRPPSAISVILRSIEMMQSRLAPEIADAATLIITPELPELEGGKLRAFNSGVRYVEDGAAAAREAMPRLAAALPWLLA